MADEKIGKVKSAWFFIGQRRESLFPGIERVAMRAFDAAHPLLRQNAIELAAGSAIAIEAEDLVIGFAIGVDLRPHRLRDSLGIIVQLRRQAGDIDVAKVERKHFARQGAASDDKDAACPAGGCEVDRFGIDILNDFRRQRRFPFSLREKVAR